MLQWLWKQKHRYDRGLSAMAGLNTLLLLCQSERLASFVGLPLTAFVFVAVPVIFTLIWLCGYVMTLPRNQAAEDKALAETVENRRELKEILRILRGINGE